MVLMFEGNIRGEETDRSFEIAVVHYRMQIRVDPPILADKE